MVETVEFGEWCSVIKRQRSRLLEKTGRARVCCLACNKQFVISVESDELLYCCENHRFYYERNHRMRQYPIKDGDEIIGVPIRGFKLSKYIEPRY